MKNKFFQIALNKASRLLGKPGRIVMLLIQLGNKLKHVNWKELNSVESKEKFQILGRFTKAYTLGHYRAVPWRAMISVVAAILYFVSPIDLISDFIPVIGLTDDLGVLLWVYSSLHGEIQKFLAWEELNKMQGLTV